MFDIPTEYRFQIFLMFCDGSGRIVTANVSDYHFTVFTETHYRGRKASLSYDEINNVLYYVGDDYWYSRRVITQCVASQECKAIVEEDKGSVVVSLQLSSNHLGSPLFIQYNTLPYI